MRGMIDDTLNLLKNSEYPLSLEDIAIIFNCEKDPIKNALKTLLSNKEIAKSGTGRQIKYGLENHFSNSENIAYVSEFKKIVSTDELIAYLDNVNDRLSKTSVLCQYTNLRAVIGIIANKFWYLGSPKNMNDGLELQQGLDTRDNIFFSSFMAEQKESIAMWSMYSQPWEDGVMISIPVKEFKQWIKDIRKVYSADINTKKADIKNFVYLNKAKVFVTRVAYSNQNAKGEVVSLSCGGAKNNSLKILTDPSLIGYIKDDAWSYEKEIRLRVDLGEGIMYKGVAIEVPEYVIDSMIITKGPRFQGELLERIKNEYEPDIKTESSLFYDKLKYTPCDKCSYKNS